MITWYCPYWNKDKQDRITCEAGTIRFPDECARIDWIRRYCTDAAGWKACPMSEMMTTFYERKDDDYGG